MQFSYESLARKNMKNLHNCIVNLIHFEEAFCITNAAFVIKTFYVFAAIVVSVMHTVANFSILNGFTTLLSLLFVVVPWGVCVLIKLENQVTTLPDEFPDAHSAMNDLRLEYVVAIEGIVRSRPNESVNKKMKTGFIEVYIANIE